MIFPYPKKLFKNKEEVRLYIGDLMFNCMQFLHIDGYRFYIVFPGEEDFVAHEDSGAAVTIFYPYKKFYVSFQQNSLDKCFKEKSLLSPLWKDIERSIFHECVHVVVCALVEKGLKRFTTSSEINQEEEATVDQITGAFIDLLWDFRHLARKKR